MSDQTKRTALVTGASAGLGHEAAAQLARDGHTRMDGTARADDKAQATRNNLNAADPSDVFEPLTLDLDDLSSADRGVATLEQRGGRIDVPRLNVGKAPTPDLRRTDDGIESTAAATLTGHHRFTMRLLEAGLLSGDARIIIAGSEAARGGSPTPTPIDVDRPAKKTFAGDRAAAIEAVMRVEPSITYRPNAQYATLEMFAVWWVAKLARKLPPAPSRLRGSSHLSRIEARDRSTLWTQRSSTTPPPREPLWRVTSKITEVDHPSRLPTGPAKRATTREIT